MIEKTFINLLAADSSLQSLLSTFESAPAIFSTMAPQRAEPPYIVFDIDVNNTESRAVFSFDIICDIWHYQESGVEIRQIAERIEYLCDLQIERTDDGGRFQGLRFFYEDGREIENTDIKIRHYVIRISARAGRKKWCEQIAPVEEGAVTTGLAFNTYLNAWFSGKRQITIT